MCAIECQLSVPVAPSIQPRIQKVRNRFSHCHYSHISIYNIHQITIEQLVLMNGLIFLTVLCLLIPQKVYTKQGKKRGRQKAFSGLFPLANYVLIQGTSGKEVLPREAQHAGWEAWTHTLCLLRAYGLPVFLPFECVGLVSQHQSLLEVPHARTTRNKNYDNFLSFPVMIWRLSQHHLG